MNTIRQKQWFWSLVWVTAFIAVKFVFDWLYHYSTALSAWLGLCWAAMIVVWGIYFQYRAGSPEETFYVRVTVVLLCLWLLFRNVKYEIFNEVSFLSRYLWYLYYLPMIFLPLCFYLTALSSGSGRKRLPQSGILTGAAVLLTGMVLTNDLHQLVFRFDFPGIMDDKHYSYGFGYYLIVLWMAGLLFLSLAELWRKSPEGKMKRFGGPFIVILVTGLYCLLFLSPIRLFARPPLQITEVFILATVLFWESCLQGGLIPSNVGYEACFNASTIYATLADNNGKIWFQSRNAIKLSPEVLKAAIGGPYPLNNRIVLRTSPIRGGYIYWSDNVAMVNDMNRRLKELKDDLQEENELLRARNELAERSMRVGEQTRLYDQIHRAIDPWLKNTERLIESLDPSSPDFDAGMAKACVLGAYIKRYSNLLLLSENRQVLESGELGWCLRESLDYARLCGIGTALDDRSSGLIRSSLVRDLYEAFETILEQMLDARFLHVIMTGKGRSIRIRIEAEGLPENWNCPDLPAGILKQAEKEDGIWYLGLQEAEV